MPLRNRIDRLAGRLVRHDPGDCPGPPTCLIDAGEPMPTGDDAGRCELCGSAHVLVIDERIVEAASEGGGPMARR